MRQLICDRCGKKIEEKDNAPIYITSKCGINGIVYYGNGAIIVEKDLCISCAKKIVDKIFYLVKTEIDDGISIHEVMERDKNSIRLSYDEDTVTKKDNDITVEQGVYIDTIKKMGNEILLNTLLTIYNNYIFAKDRYFKDKLEWKYKQAKEEVEKRLWKD